MKKIYQFLLVLALSSFSLQTLAFDSVICGEEHSLLKAIQDLNVKLTPYNNEYTVSKPIIDRSYDVVTVCVTIVPMHNKP